MDNSSRPTVTFWGAAQCVTGSMHLVQAGKFNLLLDCGLVVGQHHEGRERNRFFPFDPCAIDAVVLSHAHVDHCGNLPNLVRQGFRGPIYCTPATRDLLALILSDSARIQEEDAYVHSVIGRTEGPAAQALFTAHDVEQTVQQCVALPYDRPQDVGGGMELRLADAAHILGSAMVALRVNWAGGDARLTFTGDLGRHGVPLLPDPAPIPEADLLLCESTYGGRVHEPIDQTADKLAAVVQRTIEQGGKVLIPSFTLGRTQVVIYCLQRIMREGRAPHVPIFVDSRLGGDFAEVYQRYPQCLHGRSGEAAQLLTDPGVHYVRSPEKSKELCTRREPCIIVASGGMCEGGRIMNHLKQNVDDPRCSIVLVSYQAPHTLGHRLRERCPIVRFHGRRWNKWAEVVDLTGFSGHADHNDLLALLGPLAGKTARVRLVHGEVAQAEALAHDLRSRGFPDVTSPHREETVTLA